MKVLIAAGGTGGHVLPAIAVGETLAERGNEVHFVGGDRMEANAVPAAGFPLHKLPARPFAARPDRAARMAATLARSTLKARTLLRELEIDVVLGMGGYHSAAPCYAARSIGVPVVLHEQNGRLALAHRAVIGISDVLAYSVPLTADLKIPMVQTGNPLRRSVAELARATPDDREGMRADALAFFAFDSAAPVLLVTGGSLGAGRINDAVLESKQTLGDLQVIHLTGPAHVEAVQSAWGETPRVRVFGYLPEMVQAFACADIVVARSGGAVSELTACGLASVLVPGYFAAGLHQHRNAEWLASAGAAVVVDERSEVFAGDLAEAVNGIASDPGRRHAMSQAARDIGIPDASERLADLVEKVANDRGYSRSDA